tara:strand:+ start:548 stop:763 length:216 start_codon:yes stop_codon:yes gene_type:complete
MYCKDKALLEIECLKGALGEAERLIKQGANPLDICQDFSKNKSSDNWIVVTSIMALCWYKQRTKNLHKSKT